MKDNKEFFDNLENDNKTKCVNCGKIINNLEKGCSNCNSSKSNYSNDDDELENINKEQNTIASILKVIAWIILLTGFILGFVLGRDSYDDIAFGPLIQIWIIYGGMFLGIYALAEVIQILHDIRKMLYKK